MVFRAMVKTKEELLNENGFKYNFTRMIYFNEETKKIFSFEVIDVNDESWLETKIKEKNHKAWRFYFNDPAPSKDLEQQIISELEKPQMLK